MASGGQRCRRCWNHARASPHCAARRVDLTMPRREPRCTGSTLPAGRNGARAPHHGARRFPRRGPGAQVRAARDGAFGRDGVQVFVATVDFLSVHPCPAPSLLTSSTVRNAGPTPPTTKVCGFRLPQMGNLRLPPTGSCFSVQNPLTPRPSGAGLTGANPPPPRGRSDPFLGMPPIPAGALPAAPQPPVFGRQRQPGRRMPRQPRPPGATPGSPGSRAGLTVMVKDSEGKEDTHT